MWSPVRVQLHGKVLTFHSESGTPLIYTVLFHCSCMALPFRFHTDAYPPLTLCPFFCAFLYIWHPTSLDSLQYCFLSLCFAFLPCGSLCFHRCPLNAIFVWVGHFMFLAIFLPYKIPLRLQAFWFFFSTPGGHFSFNGRFIFIEGFCHGWALYRFRNFEKWRVLIVHINMGLLIS